MNGLQLYYQVSLGAMGCLVNGLVIKLKLSVIMLGNRIDDGWFRKLRMLNQINYIHAIALNRENKANMEIIVNTIFMVKRFYFALKNKK